MSDAPPGAQWERTRLAWRRTVLTATVVSLLALREASLVDTAWRRTLIAAVVILIWLACLVTGHHRIITLNNGKQSPGRLPLCIAAVTLGFATLGILSVIA